MKFKTNIYIGQNISRFLFDDYKDAMNFAITALNTAVEECEVEISIIKEDK